MSDLNVFTVVGRLTKDATTKQAGQSTLVEFDLANNTGFGQYACTNFFKVKAWGKQALGVVQYLTQGKQVALSGTLEQKKWTGNDGMQHTNWELTVNGPINLLASPHKAPEGSNTPPSFDDAYNQDYGDVTF